MKKREEGFTLTKHSVTLWDNGLKGKNIPKQAKMYLKLQLKITSK